MIRAEVEKIKGMVFTPEELVNIIIPAVEASNSKLYHDSSETKKAVKTFYYKYYCIAYQAKKDAKLYGILSNMAKNDQDKLISIWNKILETRFLKLTEDIDEELFLAFSVGSPFMVYNDIFRVERFDIDKIYFKLEK